MKKGSDPEVGASVSYGYDSAGRIQSLSLTTETLPATAIVANVIYQPLGPVKSYQLPAVSGAPIIARGYDSNGRVASYTLIENIDGVPTLVAKTLRYDRLGNLTVLGDPGTTANDRTYGYDKLNRLTNLGAPGLAHRYVYDAAGNRTLRTINGVTTGYTPQIASNRLAAVGGVNYLHDASGNITDNGPTTFHYDAKGRLRSATTAASVVYTYGINGLGQRVTKTSPALPGGRVYVYDGAGHLAGEYTNSGARIQEHIWLGDVPVAVISGGGAVFHVLSDHLGTPRQILDSAKRLRWRWDNTDPFGVNAPNQNPQGLGGFGYNLRFPGQYFDAEAGLFYNYFRDYDPRLGRYVSSDPIGLAGGINTYAYADSSPATGTDPLGLATFICTRPLGAKPGSWAPPVFNHTYVCVGGGPGNMTCGSTAAATEGIWPNVKEGSPGVPTIPDKDYYHPDACDKRWDEDSCIETCIANELKKPTRPWYAVGPKGDDCQEYTWNIVHICERRCARR